MYPYISLQNLSRNECIKKYYFDKQISINNYFRFYYCKINKFLDGHFGFLLIKSNNSLYFFINKRYSWYFSKKLKLAKMNGYKIRII